MLSLGLMFFEAHGCSVTAGGTAYDLSALQNMGVVQVAPDSSESGYKYEISFCKDKAECQGNLGSMVRLRSGGQNTCLGIYGEWDNAGNEGTPTPNGFSMSFQSEYYCSDDFSKKYSSVFNFICGDSDTPSGLVAKRTGSDACEYSVDISIAAACGASGLSGGSIFLITLVSVAFLYVIVGFGFFYHKEKAFGFPSSQKGFWCSKLPFWVKTGLMVTWVQMMTCWRFTMKKIFKAKDNDDKMEEGLIKDDSDGED